MSIDTIISDIYACANGRGDWSTTLAAVASSLDLWTVQVFGVDKRNGHLMFSVHGGKATPQTALDYFRKYHAIDSRMSTGLATPRGQWFHCHEHFDDAFVARDPFYQEFLIPHGGRYASGTVLVDDDEVGFMLAMLRGCGSPPLSTADLPLMEAYRHHFTEAMHNLVHTREVFAEVAVARELLNQFAYPMFLVDETRGIWHRNAGASKMLARADVVTDRAGMLACRDKTSDEALTEAVYSLQLSKPAGADRHKRLAVPLFAASGSRHLAFATAVRPNETMGAFGHRARALIILHDPSQSRSGVDPFIAAECFDFTPAEAQVAVLIARGASAKEIARHNGTAITTVRSHIRRVMEKAGVERQADLIRKLMALPSRTN